MKVLIIGTLYEPDLGASAPLFTMLSKALVQRGHQVTVITMVPHYPTGRVSAEFRGKWIWRSNENGVNVIRIGLPSVNRKQLAQRLFQYISYQIGATISGIGEKYDVVLAANPALTVWLPFFFLVFLKHKPSVYSVNDVYPDVGIKLGIFKHKLVISIVSAMERFCLLHSGVVHMISDSFRPALHELGVPHSKMSLIDLWVDTALILPLPKDTPFAIGQGLADYFVIQYAGNIGLSQGLEIILKVANILRDQKEIRFVFVGDGFGRQELQNQAQEQQLNNVQFIPYQPRERLPEVLACSDVSFVILRKGIGITSLPSKIYSIMASGRPILASIDEQSETWKLIERSEAGLCVPPEDSTKLAEAVLTLKNDKSLCELLGRNGRAWVEQHHSPQNAAEQFEKILFEAISYKNRL